MDGQNSVTRELRLIEDYPNGTMKILIIMGSEWIYEIFPSTKAVEDYALRHSFKIVDLREVNNV